jgi:hypothetical protein
MHATNYMEYDQDLNMKSAVRFFNPVGIIH